MKKRLVLSVFSFLMTVLVTAYIAWPVWTVPVVRAVLADYEIHLLQADISRPEWNTLSISDVALTYQAADHVTKLSSPKVTLTYSWRQLLQGQLEILSLPAVRLQLTRAHQKKQASAEPLSLPLILPEAVFAQLPVAQIQMDLLELVLPEGAGYQALAGKLHYTAEQLVLNLASLGAQDDELPNLILDLKIDRENRLELSLTQAAEPMLTIRSQIVRSEINNVVQPAQLQGNLSLDLQAGAELLRQLGMIDSSYQLNGKAQLHWQGPLPEAVDENAWQRLLLTGELSSHGNIAGPHSSMQAQFDIKAHFQLNETAVALRFPVFNLNGVADLSSELAPWLSTASTKALPVEIKLTPNAQLHAGLAPFELRLEEGTAELTVGRRKTSVFAQLQLQSLRLQAEKDWRALGHFKAQLAVKQVQHTQLTARALAFSTAGQASLQSGVVRLQLDAGSSLQGTTLKAEQGQIAAVDINIPRAFDVILQGQKLTVPELELQFGDTKLRWQDQIGQFAAAKLRLHDFLLDWENTPHVISHIDSQVTGVQAATGDLQLKPLDFNGSWQLTEKMLRGTVQLKDTAGVIAVSGKMKHNLNSGRGTLTSQLQGLEFRQKETYLPNIFEAWPYPFDVFSGQLALGSTLSWDASQVRVKGRLQLKDVGGFYDTNLFYGLNTELIFDGPLADIKVVAEQFKIDSLDVGIPIENVTFSLQSTANSLQVKDFKAELFGGQVGQKLVTYDWTQDENELLLQLQGVQLSELLQLELGVEGYAILDGQLPLKITRDGVTMKLGQVQARSPGGVIKYQGGQSLSSAAANVGVAFALDALQNFHFDVLDVKADYAEDGQLRLEAALLGRNPDLQEQRPVRFNINIQENIPALVKSLKLTQHISDDIERRLKAFYE